MISWFKNLFNGPKVGDVYFNARSGPLETWEFEQAEMFVVTDVGKHKVRGKRAYGINSMRNKTHDLKILSKKDLKDDWVKNNEFRSKLDVFKDEIDKIKNDL